MKKHLSAARLIAIVALGILTIPMSTGADQYPPIDIGGGAYQVLTSNTSLNIPTAGTAIEILASYTLPGGTVSAASQSVGIEVIACASASADTHSKTLGLRLDSEVGTSVCSNTGAVATDFLYCIDCRLYWRADIHDFWNQGIKTSPELTAQQLFGTYDLFGYLRSLRNASGANTFTGGVLTSAGIDWTLNHPLVITGTTPTAAGDLVLRSFQVLLITRAETSR